MFDLGGLTYFQMGISLSIGVLLGFAYLIILWKTLMYLPKVQKRGNFLFASAVIRLFLFIFVALYFSYGNGARFILIFLGFIITRLIVLKYIKSNILTVLAKAQKQQQDNKKTKPSIKSNQRRKQK